MQGGGPCGRPPLEGARNSMMFKNLPRGHSSLCTSLFSKVVIRYVFTRYILPRYSRFEKVGVY